jgi:phage tail-like protein
MTTHIELAKPQPKQATRSARLSVIAADYSRYPGEETRLHIRVDALAGMSALALNIDLPRTLEVVDVIAPAAIANSAPAMRELRNSVTLNWETQQRIPAGAVWEWMIVLRVAHEGVYGEVPMPASIDCDIAVNAGGAMQRTSTTATILLLPKARYVRHLPGIYRDDVLMNQMLMMFESFWKPIESQITQIHNYFDPKLAPASLLPFLASWADFELDDRWPESARRELIANMVQINRKRGTRDGLAHMLKIFTGVMPDIIERRADNMVVGVASRLGFGIALGKENVPHTFTVRMKLPALPPHAAAERRRMIEVLIEREKPAHTQFTLEITH